MQSVVFLLLSIPLAALIFLILLIRRIFFAHPIQVTVLHTDNEFGLFVQLMEFMRVEVRKTNEILFVLAKSRHKTLSDIYRREIDRPIIWTSGVFGLLQQSLLLQPSYLVVTHRLTNRVVNRYPTEPIAVSSELVELRTRLLAQINCKSSQVVAMAVFTLQYEENSNPRYLSFEKPKESRGAELAGAVDYLLNRNIDVVMLGATDSGVSRIPRNIPRLSEFGQHGGPEEVAIASGCMYFWSDNVGASWLSVPFGRPVLFTNFSRIVLSTPMPRGHLTVPCRYETLDGRKLTIEELLATRSPTYKAVSRGDLRLKRNSPDELLEAHREMIDRLNGTWSEDNEARELRIRLETICSRYEDLYPFNVSSYFLKKHRYLLD